ncbi:MAG: hypothetical protein QM528_08020 [Phycisphaerales bacterium]|nr:hypothetical protein [Phycisphaerales bacterium]
MINLQNVLYPKFLLKKSLFFLLFLGVFNACNKSSSSNNSSSTNGFLVSATGFGGNAGNDLNCCISPDGGVTWHTSVLNMESSKNGRIGASVGAIDITKYMPVLLKRFPDGSIFAVAQTKTAPYSYIALISKDKGSTFNIQPFNTNMALDQDSIASISLANENPNIGLIVTANFESTPVKFTTFQTEDTGITWTKINLTVGSDTMPAEGHVRALSNGRLYVLAQARITPPMPAIFQPLFYKSVGGNNPFTLDPLTTNFRSSVSYRSKFVPKNRNGFVFYNSSIGAITIDSVSYNLDTALGARIYMTNDGGNTWTPSSVIQPKLALSGRTQLVGTTFATANTAFAYGSMGALYYYSNGVWADVSSRLPLVSTMPPTLYYARFSADGMRGYLLGISFDASQNPQQFYTFTTKDGGNTWQPAGKNLRPNQRLLDLLMNAIIL